MTDIPNEIIMYYSTWNFGADGSVILKIYPNKQNEIGVFPKCERNFHWIFRIQVNW